MAWKLPRRGGGFDTSGFDTSGDETWQLARNVQPTDKGVYQQNWAGFTGLTPGGEDVNKYRQDWQDFSKSAEGYDLGTKKHLFMENYLGNVKPTLEDLKNRYPGAAELGMTPEDVYEQEELYKDAPKGYGWFNQGGIASLENRPGYRWGGSSKEDPVHGYVWGGGGGPHGSYMTNRDITGGNLEGVDMYGQTMRLGRGISPAALARGYVDVSDRPRDIDPGMGVWPVTPGFNKERILPEWLKRESKILEEDEKETGPTGHFLRALQNLRPFNEGGAVGLEPGIASLMGYAKGGMVTRVKVPKGQSKWMKRFVNNMRDS